MSIVQLAPTTPTFGLQVELQQRRPIPLDLRLACAPGDALALVGPSGSGKTTVLRAIAGLLRPGAGRVICDGETWFDAARGLHLSPQRRAVGLVFQHYALFPHMSALENVACALGHLPRHQRAARAREWLSRVHLGGLETRKPAQLSGGQQQRVAVARALAREPRVLLLDEPFSAVDQVTRRRLYRELAELRRQLGIPLLLVTHDLDEASLLADRICVLHHGAGLQCAPPRELLTRPASPLVARIMDQRNLFEGVVAGHEAQRTWLRWGERLLETRLQPAFPPGTRVSWMIPAASVLLHRRDRPSLGERENPVGGRLTELVPLGEHASVVMAVDDDPGRTLSFTVSLHAAQRNHLAPGVMVRVSLLADAIHLMPWEERRPPRGREGE